MSELAPEVQQFLDEPHLAVFVTLMRDGSPQATPVWVDHDGSHVVVNTVAGHQKERNIARDDRVALCIVDHGQAGRYLQVRGRVIDTDRGPAARQHIDKLSLKYSGRPYPARDGEQRVKVTIDPRRVDYRAGRGQSGRWRG